MARTFTQVAPDSTGDKIAAQDIVDGADTVLRQEVLVSDPTTLAGVAKVGNAAPGSTDYGLTVRQAGDGLVLLNSAAVAATGVLATQDTSGGYNWFQFQAAGTFTFTVLIEGSDDNTNWVTLPLFIVSSSLPISVSSSVTGTNQYYGYCRTRYIRARVLSFTSSTSGAVTFLLRSSPPPVEFVNVNLQSTSIVQPVQPNAITTNLGFSSARVASAASTNATSVKASGGNLYGGFLSNTSASAKFIKFYNKASAPTVGTDTPIWTLLLPAGQSIPLKVDMNPLRFGTGIAYAITGAVADSDTTAVAANDVHGFLNYA